MDGAFRIHNIDHTCMTLALKDLSMGEGEAWLICLSNMDSFCFVKTFLNYARFETSLIDSSNSTAKDHY